ncbi:MAG: hypothetical protein V7L23_31990 [Nostoc sp.]|uniref:hypothetical protein n=1 Tax=Nostoc sp. TaxID=1180 RepID=UPI002FF4011A
MRQAVLEQGEKWRLALSFASPAYPSSIGWGVNYMQLHKETVLADANPSQA